MFAIGKTRGHRCRRNIFGATRACFHELLRDDSGAEIAEAAVVLPITFLVIFAVFWFALAFNISSTLERAARAGIATGTHASCALCGNSFPTSSQIVSAISSVLQDDHLDPRNLVPYTPPFACVPNQAPSCSVVQGVEICTGVPLDCGSVGCQSPPAACGANPVLGTRVSFGYKYSPPVPLPRLSRVTIHATAQSEPET